MYRQGLLSLVASYLLLFCSTMPISLYVYFHLFSSFQLSIPNFFILHNTYPFIYLLDIAIILNIGLLLLTSLRIANYISQQRLLLTIDIANQLQQLTGCVVTGGSRKEIFEKMLDGILYLTKSEFGFIGEVLEDNNGKYLKTFNISNIAWDEASKELYRPEGMEFRNLDSLFGQVLSTGETLISNNPSSDVRSAGLPPGHPPLHSFLGLALKHNNVFIGMIGVANSKKPYNYALVNDIELYLDACSNILLNEKIQVENIAKNKALNTVITSLSDGFVVINEDSTIETVNDSMLSMFGYTENEMVGMSITLLMDPVSKNAHLKGMYTYLHTGNKSIIGKNGVFVNALSKNGNVIPIEITVNEISFGGSRKFCAVIRDISEKVEFQKNLKTLLDEQKMLIENANAPIFGTDQNGIILEWNSNIASITKHQKQSVVGKVNIKELFHNDKNNYIQSIINSVIKGRDIKNICIPLKAKNNTKIEIIANFSPRRSLNGEICGLIAIGQDITDLLKSKMKAEQISSELIQFIQKANAPIFGIDNHGLINEWNEMAVRLSGYEKNEVIGLHLLTDFISFIDKSSTSDVLNNALKGIETESYEFSLSTKSGKKIAILANATTRYDYRGNIIGVISVGQDITPLIEKNSQLNQLQKMESLGLLTGGIAHDFNNLLAIIIGNLEFLSDMPEFQDDTIKEVIDDASSAAHDGAELIKSLLAFAKNQTLIPKSVDVNLIVQGFDTILRRSIPNNIEIQFIISEQSLTCYLDSSQLESSLLNLCLNSVDAITGNGKITISTDSILISKTNYNDYPALQFGEYAVIKIIDNGVGINDEDKDHIFEPFYSKKIHSKGTGLGLSMVHGFVSQSKGCVTVSSESGKGSIFSIMLPLYDLKEIQIPEVSSKIVDAENILYGEINLLLVDDEPSIRNIQRRILQNIGINTYEAESGEKALELLATGIDIDILLSDIIMPGKISGRELADNVSINYPAIKILLATGYEELNSSEISNDRKTYPVLRKPYNRQELIDKLLELAG